MALPFMLQASQVISTQLRGLRLSLCALAFQGGDLGLLGLVFLDEVSRLNATSCSFRDSAEASQSRSLSLEFLAQGCLADLEFLDD